MEELIDCMFDSWLTGKTEKGGEVERMSSIFSLTFLITQKNLAPKTLHFTLSIFLHLSGQGWPSFKKQCTIHFYLIFIFKQPITNTISHEPTLFYRLNVTTGFTDWGQLMIWYRTGYRGQNSGHFFNSRDYRCFSVCVCVTVWSICVHVWV